MLKYNIIKYIKYMRAPGDFVFTALDCFSPPTRIIVEYHPMMPRYKYKEVVIPADWYDSSISIQFLWFV